MMSLIIGAVWECPSKQPPPSPPPFRLSVVEAYARPRASRPVRQAIPSALDAAQVNRRASTQRPAILPYPLYPCALRGH